MTYGGNFTNKQNTVHNPNMELFPLSDIPWTSSTGADHAYQAGDYQYIISQSSSNGRNVFKAPLKNPTYFYTVNKSFQSTSSSERLGQFHQIGSDFYIFGGIGDFLTNATNQIWSAKGTNPESWFKAGNMDTARQFHTSAIVGSNIYMYGGQTFGGFSALNSISVAPISNLNSWSTAGATLPVNLAHSTCAVIGSFVYLFGGTTNSQNTGAVSTIYRATTAAPTVFTAVGNLPIALYQASFYDDGSSFIYLIGGHDNGGTYLRTVYRASYSDPLTWTLLGTPLVEGKDKGAVFFNNNTNKIYVTGGQTFSGTAKMMIGTIASAVTNNAWTAYNSNEIFAARTNAACYTDDNNIYLFGGESGYVSPTSTIQYTSINNPMDGWSNGFGFPAGITGGTVVRIDDYLYMIGGYTTNGAPPVTYRAPVSSPMSWLIWNTSSCPTYEPGVCIAGDYIYAVGGFNNSFSAQSSVYRCPIANELKNNDWKLVTSLASNLIFPSLAVVGSYIYSFGGLTSFSSSGDTRTSAVYRANLNNPAAWTAVTNLAAPTGNANVVMLNNSLYLIGGYLNHNQGNTTMQCCSLSDLYQGKSNFNNIANTIVTANGGSAVTYVNDTLYLLGASVFPGTPPNTTKSSYFFPFKTDVTLAGPITESISSVPAIDSNTGASIAYTSFQLNKGMLPWRTNKRTR